MTFTKLRNLLFSAARVLALVGFGGLMVLAVLTTLDVLLRWTISYPIQGVNDVSSVVMAVVIAACIPSNLVNKQSISVEVLGKFFGLRGQLIITAFSSFCTMIFVVLMAWQFIPYAADLFGNGQRTWVLAWPVWPWWFFATGAILISAIVQIVIWSTDARAALNVRNQALPPSKEDNI